MEILPVGFDQAASLPDSFQLQAHGFYRALIEQAGSVVPHASGTEPNFGGTLLYASELDAQGRVIVVAGSVAGCATLSATGDSATPKQAIRDGIIDFLVNSLDEALRILKNEIRKREPVAACVGLTPDMVEREMIERGVLPDLMFADPAGHERNVAAFGSGVCRIEVGEPNPSLAFISWQAAQSGGRWMPKLDAIALECLGSDPWSRRWIRLSPRYCGRALVNQRGLSCDSETARNIADRIENAVRGGQVETEVLIAMHQAEGDRVICVVPGSGSNR